MQKNLQQMISKFWLAVAMVQFGFISPVDNKSPGPLRAATIQSDFIAITETCYIQKAEVSNKNYQLFVDHLVQTGQEQAQEAFRPDTTKWLLLQARSFAEYYHVHPSFRSYPVVNISYEAAQAYCAWLTTTYMQDSERPITAVIFRLPTEDEWLLAAHSGNTGQVYPWSEATLKDKNGKARCNYFRVADELTRYDSASDTYRMSGKVWPKTDFQSPVNAYTTTGLGFYNLAGNVAEMVAEKGIAKGGSFRDGGADIANAARKTYSGPMPDIGFRVAMEIVRRNPNVSRP